jgi:diguanylate cyclase (GGDEF)-like protein
MKKFIYKILVKESYNDNEFSEVIFIKNIERLKLFLFAIAIIEFSLYSMSYINEGFFDENLIEIYRMHYLILFILVIILSIIIYFFKTNKINNIRILNYILGIALILGLMWSVSISIIDFNRFGSIIVYITFLFIIGVVVLYRPDIYLIIYVCANLFFIYKLSFLDIERSKIFATEINATIFVIFSWSVSRIQYLNEYEKYKKDKIILEKNKMLEIKNSELLILSTVDSLTGLYNRRELESVLKKEIEKAFSNKTKITIIMIDIDQFKKINDTYGHIIGDKCLLAVSNILKELSKKYEGYSFRYGGDEFCIITDKENANSDLIEEINNNNYEVYIKSSNARISMNLSIGSFSDIPDDIEINKYIDLADHILYGNKRERRLRESDYNRI